ncbi:MAG: hypothetical protein WDW36_007839 [Sanguina aurantia]
MISACRRSPVTFNLNEAGSSTATEQVVTVDTAFYGPSSEQLAAYPSDAPAFVLLHSFDSSCLEFRRLVPLLSTQLPTYAVDLVGWGFSDVSIFADDPSILIQPAAKRNHLAAFIQQQLGDRPLILVGASVGGAVAIDFTLAFPKAVTGLVLIDAQGFIDGLGMMPKMPRFLAEWGVQLLKTEGLRVRANDLAYQDKATFATTDAMRVGRLHTFQRGWAEANVAFIRGGGYSLSARISAVTKQTLVLWGRQDRILAPDTADRFRATLPNNTLTWVEQCGHSPHIEQAEFTAAQLMEFVVSLQASGEHSGTTAQPQALAL